MSTVTARRVFILEPLRGEDSAIDLKRHGTPELIFTGVKTPSVFNTEDYADSIVEWMDSVDYDPKTDAFVVTGRLTKVAIALAVISKFARDAGSPVRVLIYDGNAEQYVERFI